MRASPSFAREPACFLKFGVCPRHRVRSDAEIAGELPYRRQRITGTQLATLDEAAQLIHDLLEGRGFSIRIDREEQLVHEAAAHDKRSSRCTYHATHAHNDAHATSEA